MKDNGNAPYSSASQAAEQNELERLRQENFRLKSLLAHHGITWNDPLADASADPPNQTVSASSQHTVSDKIALFQKLFRGRNDTYAVRWESATGKSGYAPACGNEWRAGICQKPKIKCSDCNHRLLLPLTEQTIYDHLAGKHTIGVYPLLDDDHCHFLAADFDEATWRDDSLAFMQSCRELSIPAAMEISRSGNGAHIWIFFNGPVPARDARQLGAALISYTCNRTRQLSLASYDRLFPNQDTLPKGGFGNLIALPLQKQAREQGRSVFVDDQLEPYTDQWAFLASIQPLSNQDLEAAILEASGGRHPLDVSFSLEEEHHKPWERPSPTSTEISGPLPTSLTLVQANQIFIAKNQLPQQLTNRLIRLAAFQNPEFYKAQAMRFPVWNKPRIIGCAENYPQHIALPRGCLEAVQDLLADNNIGVELQDERLPGQEIQVKFTGSLRKDQKAAVKAMQKNQLGVLSAPTAFGKTITATALIARRKVSTLILVHRNELMRQWQERLAAFLELPDSGLGMIGGGKHKPSGNVDIAILQSLSRRNDLTELLDQYGQIIVDECHHLSAFSFESILKQVKSRYITGLTATPFRRDGHHPIIFMQCGPIRHHAKQPETAPAQLEVHPCSLPAPAIPEGSSIQDVFRSLATDHDRNRQIAEDVITLYQEGRKILVLTERTDHLSLLQEAIERKVKNCFVLHGRLSKKQRSATMEALENLGDSASRVLLATGRLIGEGFDHAPLDTLVLAMPISWKGTLQQYAGRLHRDHHDKQNVRIYDYIEPEHPQLARMWDKRQRGYRAMGYQIKDHGTTDPGHNSALKATRDLF